MSLVSTDGIGIAFGPKVILRDASFALQPGERAGLVGPNGSGKSTLLRILAGEREADEGEVLWARGVRFGYLPQDILELAPGKLIDSVMAAVPGRDRVQSTLLEVEEDLAASQDDNERVELSGRLAELHEELADFESRWGRHKAEAILTGLGFSASDREKDIRAFSGGWKMRAALAGLLLVDPDLLLLDEPTNHLDVPSQEWFDGFLRRSRAAVLLVSHDRDFLNRQIKRVVSLEPEGLRTWTGDYEAYREQRAEEERNLELRARREAAERAEVMRFIERFRAKATKARQVQSRVKMLEKRETVTVREERAVVRFRFPEVPRSGREVLRAEDLHKRFGENVVYRGANVQVLRGERVVIVGVNGAGKTTLLRMLAGELAPDSGSITLGHNVLPAYYAQHHTDLLDPGRTILQEISRLVPDKPQAWVRGILGSFLFSGDDVEKPIAVLSGGERARVALARLLVLPSNLLFMDEPTNHLDLDSSERLTEALAEYGGTLLFVSHNRSFIRQLATKVWDVKDGRIVEWPGNLDDYLHHLTVSGEMPVASAAVRQEKPGEDARERRAREAAARNQRNARVRPLRQEIEGLEKQIAALESEQRELSARMAEPTFYDDFAAAGPIVRRHEAIGPELAELYRRWEVASVSLAALDE